MTHSRSDRVEELLREEIGDILRLRFADPRVEQVAITHVRVSKDLREASVYISILSDDPAGIRETMDALEHAKGFIKRQLSESVRLRFMPELRFVHDGSAAHAVRIQQLLNQVEPEGGWDALPDEEDAEGEDEPEA